MLEYGMMTAFVLALGFSLWKLYIFMPNKPLEDDDMNTISTEQLTMLMLKVIKDGAQDEETILQMMQDDASFDHKHFWRFNQNRLRHLLQEYYINHPDQQSIKAIQQAL